MVRSLKNYPNGVLIYNLAQPICRLFHFLEQFFFTTSETELSYYHQKVSVWVAERLKNKDLRKLKNFKKISEMLGFDDKYPAVQPKAKFWRLSVKNRKKSAVFHKKNLFRLISSICLQPFVQDCLRKQNIIRNSVQNPWFNIFWSF